ncbi:LYR motif-containing protein 4 isoform X1 [Polyodon spathula]|uniref:LYR motif-containing protein 4 isoform X1 n=2 Tax=Polyodon spathula TaxID=7913 RepID=UPI001B7E2A54|nr:LYR motif-containing protein 4 isoform X1 [Polyodon spathula]
MAASSRTQVLSLYRLMLKESKNFTAYNYRTYAIRRVRDAFRENKHLEDPKTIQAQLIKARENLVIIQRQVSIGRLYASQKIVIEDQVGRTTA